MEEKTVIRNLLARVEESHDYISASLEQDLKIDKKHYGRADVMFTDYNLAIEAKGSKKAYKMCISQALFYERATDRACIVIPEGKVSEELFEVAGSAGVGLITISREKNLCIHHEPSGGWPFDYDNKIKPTPRENETQPQNTELIIDSSVDWRSKL